MFRINPDFGSLRPRTYPVMNPLRDRGPERLAERYLGALRKGEVAFVQEPLRGRERKWPVRSWRVGGRWDAAGSTAIMYWVRRGGGYAGGTDLEEEVSFQFEKHPEWTYSGFNAIY